MCLQGRPVCQGYSSREEHALRAGAAADKEPAKAESRLADARASTTSLLRPGPHVSFAAVRLLLVSFLGTLLVTNLWAATTNAVTKHAPASAKAANPNDPVEQEYRKLMADDDGAQDEIDQWIRENQKFNEKGADLAEATLRPRIRQRLEQVRKAYESFLQRHPEHLNARIAFGSFLNDIAEDEAASQQWLKARDLDPQNAAVWNNLGNYYGHNGGSSNAFVCYTKAIELAPKEPLYYHNLAITTYMFRKDAMAFFDLPEPATLTKAMALYRKAQALDPGNFPLATELAQTYYGFKPPPSSDAEATQRALQKHYDEALEAWLVALKLAGDDIEREGIFIHLARVNLMAGRFDESRRNLNLVTNAMYNDVKERLQKNLSKQDTKVLSAPPPALRAPGR